MYKPAFNDTWPLVQLDEQNIKLEPPTIGAVKSFANVASDIDTIRPIQMRTGTPNPNVVTVDFDTNAVIPGRTAISFAVRIPELDTYSEVATLVSVSGVSEVVATGIMSHRYWLGRQSDISTAANLQGPGTVPTILEHPKVLPFRTQYIRTGGSTVPSFSSINESVVALPTLSHTVTKRSVIFGVSYLNHTTGQLNIHNIAFSLSLHLFDGSIRTWDPER